MVSPDKVLLAMRSGLSFVCATCAKYWRARDAGVDGTQCLAVGKCGSPIASDTFSQYEGPLCLFENLCFVCGQPPDFGLRVYGRPKVVGVCKVHVELVKRLRPTEGPVARVLVVNDDGERLSDAPEPEKPMLRIKSG